MQTIFDELDFSQHQKEVTDFVTSFANLCQELGGAALVKQVQDEIKFKTKLGADLVESLVEAYQHIQKVYRL